MTARRPCPPAPGPLEDYAQRFDALFSSLAQRRGFRDYLQGLLLPRDRNKTLTGLAGAEPMAGAQHREVQRLQWFLSESTWDHEQVNDRRVELLCDDPATAPHDGGVLVIDDTGDRKDGRHRPCGPPVPGLGRQDRQRDRGGDQPVGGRARLLAAARRALHPGVAAARRGAGSRVPDQAAAGCGAGEAAHEAGFGFRAVVADCFYGDNPGFNEALLAAKVPFVLALKPRRGTWAPAEAAHTPVEAAAELGWHGPSKPGRWRRVTRRFRDGHTETWWAADAQLGGWGPDRRLRLVVATTDPAACRGTAPGTW